MKKLLLPLLITLLLPGFSIAQGFVTPVTTLTGESVLVTTDGRKISGDLTFTLFGPSGIMSLTIKDQESGEKVKLKAEQVASLQVKLDRLAQLEILSNQTSNLKKMMNADFNEIVDRKYTYFEQVKIPGKDKYVLTQLLNPGFASRIRVYEKPSAKTGETSINNVAVSGGEARAYFVLINGEVLEINRMRYAREFFPKIFSSCPDLIREFPDPSFQDFAVHVMYFEKFCK